MAGFALVYFEFYAKVRLRFKLAAAVGEPCISQGCPQSMVFIELESTGGIKPQLSADNLKHVGSTSDALLDAARLPDRYILAIGQAADPTKCVLICTCASVRLRRVGFFFLVMPIIGSVSF